jgi:hypothetical protein
MRGSERHVTMFMFRGLTAELKNLGIMEMSLGAELRGLGREYGPTVKSVEAANQNPNTPRLEAVSAKATV